jgi:hypothetical protein
VNPRHERERADHEADGAREDLVATLEELDRRRAAAFDLRTQFVRHRGAVLAAAGGTVAVVGGAVALTTLRQRSAKRRRVRNRWRGLRRAWEHPERMASRAADAPPLASLARKVALAFAAALGTQLSRRAAAALLPSPRGAGEGADVGARREVQLE